MTDDYTDGIKLTFTVSVQRPSSKHHVAVFEDIYEQFCIVRSCSCPEAALSVVRHIIALITEHLRNAVFCVTRHWKHFVMVSICYRRSDKKLDLNHHRSIDIMLPIGEEGGMEGHATALAIDMHSKSSGMTDHMGLLGICIAGCTTICPYRYSILLLH